MKKMISIFMALLFSGALSCSNSGIDSADSNVKDTAPMKYLEYMYDDENGKRLNDSIVADYSNGFYNDSVKEKVNTYMTVSFVEEMNSTRSVSGSSNWWEKIDVDAESIGDYLSTSEGKQSLVNRIDGTDSNAPQTRYIGTIITIAKAAYEIYSMYAEQQAAEQYQEYMQDIVNLEVLILLKLMDLHKKQELMKQEILSKMQEGFEGLGNAIVAADTGEQLRDAEADLDDAMADLNGFLTEITTIEGIDDLYRLERMKEFILFGYESMFEKAFYSAIKKLDIINDILILNGSNTIPFNMFFSDMIFMRELSMMRLSFASYVYSGNDLLNYRANVASKDIKRVEEIKKSLYKSIITPDVQEYTDEISAFLISWEINLIAHIEAINGPQNSEMVGLEDARNISNGFGTFGDLDGDPSINIYEFGKTLRRDDCTPLYDLSIFPKGGDLTALFDTGASGPLAADRYLRIVEDGVNILDPTGLNLTPIYFDLALIKTAPPQDQCYIDLLSGQFVLPRPAYWSKTESIENLTDSEVKEGMPVTEVTGSVTQENIVIGKYNNGIERFSNVIGTSAMDGSRIVKPFGDNEKDFSSGTVSTWVQLNSAIREDGPAGACTLDRAAVAHGYAEVFIGNSDKLQIVISSRDGGQLQASIYIEGVEVGVNSNVGPNNSWVHVYTIWDKDGLSDGSRAKVFINGVEMTVTGADLSDIMEFVYQIELRNYVSSTEGWKVCWLGGTYFWGFPVDAEANSWVNIDNIKVWNHVVTEDPDFEYNFGTGREEALHVIYGPNNDYTPLLVGNGNGVGYYYLQ